MVQNEFNTYLKITCSPEEITPDTAAWVFDISIARVIQVAGNVPCLLRCGVRPMADGCTEIVVSFVPSLYTQPMDVIVSVLSRNRPTMFQFAWFQWMLVLAEAGCTAEQWSFDTELIYTATLIRNMVFPVHMEGIEAGQGHRLQDFVRETLGLGPVM